jgi:hypothetical protein
LQLACGVFARDGRTVLQSRGAFFDLVAVELGAVVKVLSLFPLHLFFSFGFCGFLVFVVSRISSCGSIEHTFLKLFNLGGLFVCFLVFSQLFLLWRSCYLIFLDFAIESVEEIFPGWSF